MSKGINKVILIGRLGQDPETRHTASGGAVCNLSVATSEQWRDKQTGEKRESTEWHKVVLFGKVGEIADQYLRKGSQVYLEGRLQTRKWTDRDGNDRWTTEIVANEMQMLDSKCDSQPASRSEPQSNSAPEPARGDLEDEIPFAIALAPIGGALAGIAAMASGGIPGVV